MMIRFTTESISCRVNNAPCPISQDEQMMREGLRDSWVIPSLLTSGQDVQTFGKRLMLIGLCERMMDRLV